MSDEKQHNRAVLKVLDPNAERRADVEEALEEMAVRARETDARSVAIVMLGANGEISTVWVGDSLEMIGSLRVLESAMLHDALSE